MGRKSFMKYYLKLHLFAVISFLFFVGCAGLDIIAQETKETQAEKIDESAGNDGTSGLKDNQKLRPLLNSVLRLNYFDMSFEQFKSFALEGDPAFGNLIFLIFAGETSPYEKGVGTLLVSKTEDGEIYSTLERALVEVNPDGSKWWQVKQTVRDESIFYEVMISETGIPLVIRYIHPETGKIHETTLPTSEIFKTALKNPEESKLTERVQKRLKEEFDREWDATFDDPELIEQRDVDTSVGKIRAFHFRDESSTKTGIKIDYWLSRDLPGNIMKLTYRGPENNILYEVELVKLGKNYRAQITEPEIEERESLVRPGYNEGGPLSEGSHDEPVRLNIGEPHNGTVGPSGTSYYQVTVGRRADIYIEVTDLTGDAALMYYGRDLTFEEWRTISDEPPIMVEDYFVETGTTLYFTVTDLEDVFSEDEYSLGENYVITITEDFILSKTGVLMQGEYYTQAFELKPERTYFETLGSEGINYYKAVVLKGPNLRVSAFNLPDEADLLWLDAQDGTYSRVYSTREDGVKQMNIYGLSEGTLCFFYVAGDILKIEEDNVFKLTIEEFDGPE
jgi:hypothetical protein